MGHLPATAGTRPLRRHDITRRCPRTRARLGIGYVPQGREIFPALTRARQPAHGPRPARRRLRRRRRSTTCSSDFPRLTRLLDRPAARCRAASSRCWRWRAACARSRKLILLDEPTEGIQPSIIEEIVETPAAACAPRRGLTMVLVEQNLDFIAALSDRVLRHPEGPDHAASSRPTSSHDPALVARVRRHGAH